MHFNSLLLLLFIHTLLLQKKTSVAQIYANERLRTKLNAEEKNAFCCKNKLRCCQTEQSEETTQEPPPAQCSASFEIQTYLKDCPNLQCTNNSSSSQKIIFNLHNSNSTHTEKLTNCKQKLLLTINVINEGQPSLKSQYVIIDHIIDRATSKKINILNPYAIRIRQAPLVEMYGLNFLRSVNGEAKETVVDSSSRNYRGCDTGSESPTCGVVKHDGLVVPFSSGFCCSCRKTEKDHREVHWPSSAIEKGNEKEQVDDDDDFVPDYNKNRLFSDNAQSDYKHYKHYGFTGGSNDGKMVYRRSQKRADKSVNYHHQQHEGDTPSAASLKKRRGGQDCDDIDINSLPSAFHESAHCLTFSHIWYSMFELEKPRIMHSLQVQIFQKYEDCHGNTHWLDLTQGRTISLSNDNPTSNDKDIGIVSHYTFGDEECQDVLDYKTNTLLVPEQVASPEQFMVIPNKMISHDGKKCNSVGVGYEAFYKQKKRCAQPPGSCLQNQPNQLVANETQAEERGEKGKYFLKFFASMPENPVGYDSKSQIESIKLLYTEKHTSSLHFEINADLVTLMKPNVFATITEIYTEATSQQRTQIIVKVTNSGLLYGVYYVRLSGCPLYVPASLNNIASKSVLIAAQHQHIFKLFIEMALQTSEISCVIHVHNINQELVASRKIRIHSGDRCICVWHCQCACYNADKGLKCLPLSLEEFHAAGYQGGLPLPTQLVEETSLDALFALFFHMFMLLILTLLVMGLIKALLGLCFTEIAMWGLNTVLGIDEDDGECHCNDTGISLPAQFCLNVIFFCVYPLALINLAVRKLCFAKYTDEKSSESICFRENNEEEEFCGDENCEMSASRRSRSKKSSFESTTDGGGGDGKCCCCSLIYTSSEDKDVQCE